MKFDNKLNVFLLFPLYVLVFFCHIVNFFRPKKESNKIILLVDLGHFGDALMLTPSIKYLRNHDSSKSYKIFCITTVLGKKALVNNPDIDKVFSVNEDWDYNYDSKKWFKNYNNIYSIIRSINPEVAISCRSTAYHVETIAIFNALIKRRIGFSSKGLKSFLTDTLFYDSKAHRVIQNIDLIKLFTQDKKINISTKPHFYPNINNINQSNFDNIFNINQKVILINPFAEHKYIWNIDFYDDIIKYFISKNYQIFFIGLEKHRDQIDYFLKDNNYKSIFNLAGKTTIDDLTYILKKSDLLLTIDTGIRHLSNCFNIKVISLRKTPNLDYEFGKYIESEIIINEKKNRDKYINPSDYVDTLTPEYIIKKITHIGL